MPKPLKPVRQRDLIERLAEILIQSGVTVTEALPLFHRALLTAALAQGRGSQLDTAQQQKMPRSTLHSQMIACGLLRAPVAGSHSRALPPEPAAANSEKEPTP